MKYDTFLMKNIRAPVEKIFHLGLKLSVTVIKKANTALY